MHNHNAEPEGLGSCSYCVHCTAVRYTSAHTTKQKVTFKVVMTRHAYKLTWLRTQRALAPYCGGTKAKVEA